MWETVLVLLMAAVEVPEGCRPQPVELGGDRYWNCGQDGVFVEKDGQLQLFAPAPSGFRVRVLKRLGDSLLIQFAPWDPDYEVDSASAALDLSEYRPLASPPKKPLESVKVEVVDLRRVDVIVESSHADTLYYGDVFEFRDEKGQSLGAGVVRFLDESSATIRLWLNHSIEQGQGAQLVEWRPRDARIVAPPKVDGHTSVSARASMFIQGGNSQGVNGALLHVQGRHHLRALPLAIVLDVGPAFFTRDPRNDAFFFDEDLGGDGLVAGSVDLVAELDLNLFGFGIGGGGATFNRNLLGDGAPRSAGELVFRFRFGSRDGLMVEASPVVAFPEGGEGTLVGRVTGRFQIPLGNAFFLGAEGGGGRVGYTYGAWVLRFLAAGRGRPVSWFVDTRVGGAEVRFDGDDFAPTRALGAILGASVEARF
ncbi:MAG: hypothetical protein AAGD10_14400 [Myxococcota bacterium]